MDPIWTPPCVSLVLGVGDISVSVAVAPITRAAAPGVAALCTAAPCTAPCTPCTAPCTAVPAGIAAPAVIAGSGAGGLNVAPGIDGPGIAAPHIPAAPPGIPCHKCGCPYHGVSEGCWFCTCDITNACCCC